MAVTYGFYNSVSGDRKYNAIQMSSIFDGIIKDGIFMSIGTSMMVVATGEGRMLNVGVGRAWFDHTWTLNDAPLPLTPDQSEILLNRIDMIVLDIDQREAVRANNIIVVKGTPSSTPVAPSLIFDAHHRQYPLASVYIGKGVTQINQADITNLVGSGRCPFITGILETINIEALVAQWEDQWTQFFNAQTNEMRATALAWNAQWLAWFNQETSNDSAEWRIYMDQQKAIWEAFVAEMQDITDDTVQAKIVDLQQRVTVLEEFKDALSDEFRIYHTIQDSNGGAILDSVGNQIDGQIIFAIR